MKHAIIKFLCGGTIAIAVTALPSCTKDFESINTNPNATSNPVASQIFTKAEYDGAGNSGSDPYFLQGTMQYTTSYNDVAGFGSKYVASQIGSSYAAFAAAYPNELRELQIVIKSVKDDPAQVNLLAEAKIWRVYCYHRLTDLYGDIPYFEASLGYDSSVYKPAYDKQADIYADMLAQLESAATSLDAAKATFADADLIYGGNTDQWKKFAYSLMLRLGMRMTKVDIAAAQTWVARALAGGVITDDADIAKMSYLAAGQVINFNPMAYNLFNSDYISANGDDNVEGGKYQDVWISYLKATEDPRMPAISVVWVNGAASTDTAIQKGMSADISNSKPADFVTYSEPNPATIIRYDAPLLLFTVAESDYLQTEATLRGWATGTTAAALYEAGIRAAMRQWALIGGSAGTISSSAVDAYVAANPLVTGSLDDQMKQIYTQFWVSIFPDAHEAFSSYRRTGYPALVPNNYPGNATGGKIFRRLEYPISEQTLNADAYAGAVADQGADDFLTHIWWDK